MTTFPFPPCVPPGNAPSTTRRLMNPLPPPVLSSPAPPYQPPPPPRLAAGATQGDHAQAAHDVGSGGAEDVEGHPGDAGRDHSPVGARRAERLDGRARRLDGRARAAGTTDCEERHPRGHKRRSSADRDGTRAASSSSQTSSDPPDPVRRRPVTAKLGGSEGRRNMGPHPPSQVRDESSLLSAAKRATWRQCAQRASWCSRPSAARALAELLDRRGLERASEALVSWAR